MLTRGSSNKMTQCPLIETEIKACANLTTRDSNHVLDVGTYTKYF